MGKLLVPDDHKRTYDLFTLPNKLEVLTISDPTTTTSGAALNVRFGAMSDPLELPGLAHFIEHMLFLGTEKYPEESSYQTFVSEHGGETNAMTGMDYTNYHFGITSDHLRHTLDMFAAFFTCPLFTASATDREMNAIDSEHKKNLQSDVFRMFQFLKDTSNPAHAFSKFQTGNLETLRERPAAVGIDTRQAMIEHYRANYSANLMKLTIYGKESHEVLRQWAEELFAGIPNQDRPPPSFPGKPYTQREIGQWFHVLPVRSKRSLGLHFPLETGHSEYLTKETRYAGHLIGHESEGSILYALKQRGWAERLNAGANITTDQWSLFTISVEMTVEGVQHVEEIIEIIFGYINLITSLGVQESIYTELKNLAEMEFRYLEPSQPVDFCCELSQRMTICSGEHALAGEHIFFEYNPQKIVDLLHKLRPDNMNVYLVGQEWTSKCDKTISPYYSIQYGQETIDPAKAQRWAAAPPLPELHLPRLNPFIPEDVSLKPLPPNRCENPTVVYASEDPSVRVWFKQDDYYLKPKVCLQFALLSNSGYATARMRVLNRLLCMAVTERLAPLSYHASVAQLDYAICPALNGILIDVNGFSDKVGVFLREVFKYLKNLEVDEALLTLVRDQLIKSLENFVKEQPYRIVMDASALCLSVPRWSHLDTLPLVSQINLQELQAYIAATLQQFYMEGYFQGNILEDEVRGILTDVKESFLTGVLPLGTNNLPQMRTGKIPKGTEWVRPMRCTTPDGVNSAMHLMMQVGLPTPRNRMLCELFNAVAQSPFYAQLRTIETLGYVVFLMVHTQAEGGSVGPCGIVCLVQSSTHDPLYLYSRTYAFLDAVVEFLEEFPEADLQTTIASLVTERLERPKSLNEDADLQWREIQCEEFMWDRRQQEISELQKLTKKDLLDFFAKHLSNSSPHRRRLATFYYASQHSALHDDIVNGATGITKRVPTPLPKPRTASKDDVPSEVAAFLSGLPPDVAALFRTLPPDALRHVASMPPEEAKEMAQAPLSEIEEMVEGMRAEAGEAEGSNPKTTGEDGADVVKAPLKALARFDAAPPSVDLHYILDAGRWKARLPMYPARMPNRYTAISEHS
jgi:insulysin